MDRFRERRWMRALDEAHWLSGQPAPAPRLAFMGVGAGIAVGAAFLLTLVSIYGAHTTESKITFGLGGLTLAASAGFLISGFNQQRRRVFSMYAVGVDLVAGLEQMANTDAQKHPMEGEMAEKTLDRLESNLAKAGAYREAVMLHRARAGVKDA